MKKLISSDSLEINYLFLQNRFQAGKDRITPLNFAKNKVQHFSIIKKKIITNKYKFTSLKTICTNSKRQVCIPTIRDRIIIQILKNQLCSKYKVKYANREQIIKDIIKKISIDCPFFIIRLDIKNFFQSLSHSYLLDKLKTNSLLSVEEYILIEKIVHLSGNSGVPQGLSVSNVLSEIYLESFDTDFKSIHPSLNYYVRFVDDILIVINGSLSSTEEFSIKSKIQAIFDRYHLQANFQKCQYINFYSKNESIPRFDYLGYCFFKNNDVLSISISNKKVRNLYDKIDYIFEQYQINLNAALLLERLKYLTSKKSIFKTELVLFHDQKLFARNRKIYFGLQESYKEIKDLSIWSKFDKYIHGKILVYKHEHLISSSLARKMHAHSFEVNIRKQNLYKIHKLTITDLIQMLIQLNPNLTALLLSRESRSQLISRYFKLVDFKL